MDLIDRQDAIRIVDDIDTWQAGWRDYAIECLKALPSAQPERTDKRAETHACDCISRNGAIDDLHGRDPSQVWDTADVEVWINALPSAQPDIIHCKDCKHWMPYDWMFSEVWQSKNMDDYPEKEIGCQYCDMNMSANDFCSRSERRTDEA